MYIEFVTNSICISFCDNKQLVTTFVFILSNKDFFYNSTNEVFQSSITPIGMQNIGEQGLCHLQMAMVLTSNIIPNFMS